MIEIKELQKKFGKFEVLKNINLSCKKGECIALIGPNGWGMKIQASCMENEIVNNNFLKNTFDISTNGSLVLNTFNANYWDKYEGYDLDKDGMGDVPYHPLSLFAVLTENTPSAMLLYRSFMITLLDKSEKVLPSITPDNFVDNKPLMKSLPL